MSSVCRATKANGEPCRGTATGAHGLCWAHAPENAEQRRRGASRGGRAKANAELVELKRHIRGVVGAVLAGKVDKGVGAVALQGYNTLIRAIELERKIRETEDLERRLEELERRLERQSGGKRWGT